MTREADITIPAHDRLVREKERQLLTSISRSQAWKLEQVGLFPKRRKLSPRGNTVVWLLSELNEWIASREQVK
ncbi:helix-turn-helix transcriptional regulator [Vibrio marisflavi]|uniref:AlpA family phage regulatory protein n=1 Tax=Vibrio marisflavi CECT 7928 TaxID=634439 RepID=A0ABN8E930_9VIBR|nr:AlpA family phage regulatory protein [Vibrio marisflavi]CAH0543166.1 hypothetical protein VMF7928_04434 [Vibrio marisflavi CECT 7928]